MPTSFGKSSGRKNERKKNEHGDCRFRRRKRCLLCADAGLISYVGLISAEGASCKEIPIARRYWHNEGVFWLEEVLYLKSPLL